MKMRSLKNQKGLAMLEVLPLLVIFVMLITFGMGFFGVVHTAVLHSIASRTYAYETFRQRSNLMYFREDGSGPRRPINFSKKQWRYHAVQHESDSRERLVATTRPIQFGRAPDAEVEASLEAHNRQIYAILPRNERVAVSPAWVMVGYGLCLNAACGD